MEGEMAHSIRNLQTPSLNPFRIIEFGLQDWHWALDDVDDDIDGDFSFNF